MAFKEYTFQEYTREKLISFGQWLILACGLLALLSIIAFFAYSIGLYLTTRIQMLAPAGAVHQGILQFVVLNISVGMLVLVLAVVVAMILISKIREIGIDFRKNSKPLMQEEKWKVRIYKVMRVVPVCLSIFCSLNSSNLSIAESKDGGEIPSLLCCCSIPINSSALLSV